MNAAPELPAGYRLIALDAIDSTNDEAKRLAAGGAGGGTVVWAAHQTAGRGRRSRQWQSPPGNLYASVLLRPAIAASEAAQLSFLTALAAAEAIESLAAGLRIGMKWPNDLLLNARKVAGILLESTTSGEGAVDWIVLGVGVNLVNHPQEGMRYPATDLAAEGAGRVAPGALLAALLARLEDWRARWREEGFAPVRAAWLARALGREGAVRVDLETECIAGRFVDLSARGELVIELADGSRRALAAGEVSFEAFE